MKSFIKSSCLFIVFAALFCSCTFLERNSIQSGLVINLPGKQDGKRAATPGLDGHYSKDTISEYYVTISNGNDVYNESGEPGTQILFENIPVGKWTVVSTAWATIEGKRILVATNNPVEVLVEPGDIASQDIQLTLVRYNLPEEYIVSETIQITENTSILAFNSNLTFKRAEGFTGDMFVIPEGKELTITGLDGYKVIIDGDSEDTVEGRLVTVQGKLNAVNVTFENNNLSSESDGSAIQVENGGTLNLIECYVKDNSIVSPGIGAGVYLKAGSTSFMEKTRLGNNTVTGADDDSVDPADFDNDLFIEGNADVTFDYWVTHLDNGGELKVNYRPEYEYEGGVSVWGSNNNKIKSGDNVGWSCNILLSVDYVDGTDYKPLYYLNKALVFENEFIQKDTKVVSKPEDYDGTIYYMEFGDNKLIELSAEYSNKPILTNYENLSAAINTTGDYLLYPENGGKIELKGVLEISKKDVEVSIMALQSTTFTRGTAIRASAKNMLKVASSNSSDFKDSDEKYNLILGTINPDDYITFDGESKVNGTAVGTYPPISVSGGSARFENITICNNTTSSTMAAAAHITDKTELINCKFVNNSFAEAYNTHGTVVVNSPKRLLLENVEFSNNKYMGSSMNDIHFTYVYDTDTFIFKGSLNCYGYYALGARSGFEEATIEVSEMDEGSKVSMSCYSGSSFDITKNYTKE